MMMEMIEWKNEPIELINLLNPPFISLIIAVSINSYKKHSKNNFPLIFCFLLVPLILDNKMRKRLPRSISKKMAVWLDQEENRKTFLKIDILDYKPYVKEGIMFGIRNNFLKLDKNSNLISNNSTNKILKFFNKEDEAREILDKSNFFGRWLADSGEIHNILSLWGIQP